MVHEEGPAEPSPRSALAQGRLGQGAVQSGLCPDSLQGKPFAPSFSQLGAFQSVSLPAAPHLLIPASLNIPACCMWTPGCKCPQEEGSALSHSSEDSDPNLGSLLTQGWAGG